MSVPEEPAPAAPAAPASVRLAAGVLAAESLGLLALSVVQVVKVLTGSPRSTAYAVVAAALTLLTAAVVWLLGRALRSVRGSAYTPVLVLQLLALPVGYSLAVQAGLWRYGGPVLVLALTELGALLAGPSRRALLTPR
ncbi:MAG: hypothetical protein ABJA34_04320 [Pseudonocardiales bacterium]